MLFLVCRIFLLWMGVIFHGDRSFWISKAYRPVPTDVLSRCPLVLFLNARIRLPPQINHVLSLFGAACETISLAVPYLPRLATWWTWKSCGWTLTTLRVWQCNFRVVPRTGVGIMTAVGFFQAANVLFFVLTFENNISLRVLEVRVGLF